MYLILKEFAVTRNLNIPWYSLIELPLIALTIYTLHQFFMYFGQRNTFVLPFQSVDDYNRQIPNSWYMFNFLNLGPIVVILYIVKCLQILTFYFPSFGVLFDTIRGIKDDASGFFVLVIITMAGFSSAGVCWFGSHEYNYQTLDKSAMQVFYVMINEFDYDALYDANRWAAPFFFYPTNCIIYLIFFFLFLSLVIKNYNRIRQKK